MGLPVPEHSHQPWHCPCPHDASWCPPRWHPLPRGSQVERSGPPLGWGQVFSKTARPAGLIASQ